MGVTCALDGCEVEFEPKRKTQLYCTPAHGNLASNKRRKTDRATEAAGGRPLEDALSEAEIRDARLEETRQLRSLTAAESRLRRYESVLEDAITAHVPTKLVVPKSGTRKKPTHEWILELSDWHVGQQTRVEETGGMYYQDVSTTRRQVAKVWKALNWLHQIESNGRKIEKLHILSLGDLVDNDNLRPSQHRKVEEVITVQTVQAFDLLFLLLPPFPTILQ